MQNDFLLNARQAGKPAGKAGDNYQIINNYKTRLLTDEDKTQVFFHSTPVVTFNEKTIELDTGGWRTRTTKVRMNQVSKVFRLGYRVLQKQNEWFVEYQGEIRSFAPEQLALKRVVKKNESNNEN